MLAIELLVEEILRLQNTVCFLRAQLQEARKMQERTFAAGECPNCGHDWTAHSDFIARGEKVCWTFDPAIMDERHPYYVADVIASECDIADELVVLAIQYEEGEIIHTDDKPFCDDPSCGCHDDREAINAVNEAFEAGILTQEEATRLMAGKQV